MSTVGQKMNHVGCILCGKTIASSQTIKGLENEVEGLAKLSIESIPYGKQEGFLCGLCEKSMCDPVGMEKLRRKITKHGNSSHVILPVTWRDKDVLAIQQ